MIKLLLLIIVITGGYFAYDSYLKTDALVSGELKGSREKIELMSAKDRQKYYLDQIELIQGSQNSGLESNSLGYAQAYSGLYEEVKISIEFARADRDETIDRFIQEIPSFLNQQEIDAIEQFLMQAQSSAFESELSELLSDFGIEITKDLVQTAEDANILADTVRKQQRFIANFEKNFGE